MQASFPLLLNESIYFDYSPPPTFAGHVNKHPFRVNITSSTEGEHIVNLNAKYSRSYDPQEPPNKWTFLRPEYKFYDTNFNRINSITTKDTSLYLDNEGVLNSVSGTFVGVSGTAEFYFTDDIYNFDLVYSKQPYTTIVATLITTDISTPNPNIDIDYISPNLGNNKAIAYQPYILYYRQPDYLKISENGIRDYINPRWSSITQPVLFTINWNPFPEKYLDGNELQPVEIESNFCHYFPSVNDTSDIIINANLNDVNYQFNSNLKISYKDSDGLLTPGYCKSSFNVNSSTHQKAKITATCNAMGPGLSGNVYSPKLWISNPNAGLMSVANYNTPHFFPNITDKNFNPAQIYNFEVPIVNVADFSKGSFSTTGHHGINGIAVLPPPSFQAWATDSELNYLYRFGTKGQIISAIDINKIISDNNLGFLVNGQVSPNSITLDSSYNIWVTLYDTLSVLKLDKDANFLFAAAPPLSSIRPNINSNWYYSNEEYPFENETQNFIEPTYIDSDTSDNVWVTYSNYASGYAAKYAQDGTLLKLLQYPVNSSPQDIIIDNVDNVWIALSNNTWDSLGSLEKRDSNGVLLSSFGPIRGINNLALDNNQNIWFTYSYNKIGTIDNLSSAVNTIDLSDISDFSKYAPKDLTNPSKNTDETALEGIACDVNGFIHVINSIENQVYVFDSNTKQFLNKFYVNPQGFSFYTEEERGDTIVNYNQWNKSARAYGDWTGNRWLNKYKKFNSYLCTTDLDYILTNDYKIILVNQEYIITPEPIGLYGESNTLSFNNSCQDIFKINENYNLKDQMKDLAFMPVLQESNFLFDSFLNTIYGNSAHNDLGVSSYEKISNFSKNISDVDTCEINQLYSLADSIDENTNDYRLNYPSEIKRLVDLLSINQNRLWGTNAKNENNFKKPSDEGILNRGELLSTNYTVSAGIPVVLKTKSLNKYDFIPTGFINGLSSYPVQTLIDFIGLNVHDFNLYYEFYKFIPGSSEIITEGVIDWNNPQTTINKTISSYNEWVGNEKIIDTLFSYQLYKGLGLIK